jgi:predicted metal-binding protein
MSGRIIVCLTCDRYGSPRAGEPTPGRRLAVALLANAHQPGHQVTVRTVECLNGCPHPCTAALRTPGKCVIRFSGLTPDDAPALIETAARYATSADGDIPAEAMPASLRDKISLRIGPINAG